VGYRAGREAIDGYRSKYDAFDCHAHSITERGGPIESAVASSSAGIVVHYRYIS